MDVSGAVATDVSNRAAEDVSVEVVASVADEAEDVSAVDLLSAISWAFKSVSLAVRLSFAVWVVIVWSPVWPASDIACSSNWLGVDMPEV